MFTSPPAHQSPLALPAHDSSRPANGGVRRTGAPRSGTRRTALALAALLGAGMLTAPPAAASPSSASRASVSSAPTEPALPPVAALTVTEASRLLEDGRTTSTALVDAYLRRIEAYEDAYADQPGVNALISVNPRARAEARRLDRERAAGTVRGPLHGVPILVKDNYDTGDLPTTAGSKTLADYQPADDATQIARLRKAGAVLLAKANMHEFAAGITSISSLGGQTRNPFDQTRNPGGSSGGTGAGVAASFAAAGLGTDTCGSIRIPAAQNNLVGLRPTHGLSSRDGIVPMSDTQDVGGPITKSVADTALLLDATAGEDPADPVTEGADAHLPHSYADTLDDAVDDRRVGLLVDDDHLGDSAAERPVSARIRAATRTLEQQGVEVVAVRLPRTLEQALDGAAVIEDEFRRDLNAYLAGPGAQWPEGLAERTAPAGELTLSDLIDDGRVDPGVLASLREYDAADALPNPGYRKKLASRKLARTLLATVLESKDLDALAYPTIRQTARRIGTEQPGSNCALSAQTGFPALTVPAGLSAADEMPVGLELLGRPYAEPTLLNLGHAYETATHHRRIPPTTPELPTARMPAARIEPPNNRP